MPAQVFVSARTALHPAGSPIENVHVAIHEVAGDFLTEGTTDVDGQVFLGNRNAGTYEIRITPPKPGKVQDFATRQDIVVVDGDPLVFDVVIDTTTLPVSGDAKMCRMSGLFVDDSGAAARGITVTFSPTNFSPNLLRDTGSTTSYGVTGASVSTTTDKTGHAVLDLPRGMRYRAQMSTYPNMGWDVLIPDLSSSSLPDVVFPKPQTVEYRTSDDLVLLEPVSAPTIMINQGGYAYLDVEVIHRSGLRVKGLKGVGLQGDDNYYMIGVSAKETGRIKITGKSPGVVLLSVVDPAFEAEGYDVRVHPAMDFVGNIQVTVIDDPDIPDIDPPVGDDDDEPIPPVVIDGGEF